MSIKVTGIKEIDAVFKGLKVEVSHKLIQSANAEAAIPMVNEIHLQAPVGKTGNLADSIGTEKPSIRKVDLVGAVNVGPRRGGKNKGYHAHLVEYPKTNRDGSKTTGNPFMQRAFAKTKDGLFSRFNEIVGKRMNRMIKGKLKNA